MAAALVGAPGCTDTPAPDQPAKEGELGVGTFFYVCVGDSDPYCDSAGQADDFPNAIAVGGRFALAYNPDRDQAMPTIMPGSDSIVVDGADLRVVQAGWSVVFASTGLGDVFDLLHISGRDIERIALRADGSMDLARVELQPGERMALVGEAQDASRSRLAGSVTYTWASDDETIFRIATADVDESTEIEAVGVGVANLTVSTEAYTQTLVVEVTGDPVATGTDDGSTTEDSGDTGSSGSDTSGSGSDSDSESSSDSRSESDSSSSDDGGSSSTGGE